VATAIARAARFYAARCPYSRAHIEVNTSANQIAGGLLRIQDDHTPTARDKRGLQMPGAEAGQPIAVFHDQDANGRV
jgi:hypothetical protein